jgi:nucleoside-diphosphate-sugar epimerase
MSLSPTVRGGFVRQGAMSGGRLTLVTGATGFVGGAVAASLLRAGERLVALVRGATPIEARARLARSVGRFAESDDERVGLARAVEGAEIIVGDLADEGALADARLDRVTHALHAAACTSFRSRREVYRTNVLGSLALARRMAGARRLERFVHVSTAYCCGVRAVALLGEDEAPSPGAEHVADYTRSKAEAEARLPIDVPGLPLLLVRPSIVVGHTRLGCGPSSSLFWYYRALAALGRAPFAPPARRDVVPVDYVDAALQYLLFLPRPRHRVYHVSAGPRSAMTWSAIAREFARLGAPCPAGEPHQVAPDRLAPSLDELARVFGPGDVERLSRGLELCARVGAAGAEVFDNGRLLDEGAPEPPSFVSYLPRCLETSLAKSIYEQLDDDA